MVEVVAPEKDVTGMKNKGSLECNQATKLIFNATIARSLVIDQKTAEVWFIDSDCSNQMTSLKPIFKELNQGENLKVELENGKELQVEGKGTVGIETHDGNRILTNIQYMPDIGYNLLSVGQLMESGIQSCLMMVRA
ncbi:Retrovirus-related Pol polyprotein from transposon TNT 1-94 [Cucumis melo var. makuwa]|uniref:Retrovirus-related Pol polyprotein from transposon TNT 1-94 n=1 Tax=Cucumis melo var. makuwa TaxID=1194695 RepID=A0A5D3BYQ6_CUCMM|nr:Retrovirus-related Pol polyprotein from transposon TNT 1-94 [Cucumis melo var. makuwa]